jgi:hypothetical protein
LEGFGFGFDRQEQLIADQREARGGRKLWWFFLSWKGFCFFLIGVPGGSPTSGRRREGPS